MDIQLGVCAPKTVSVDKFSRLDLIDVESKRRVYASIGRAPSLVLTVAVTDSAHSLSYSVDEVEQTRFGEIMFNSFVDILRQL